MNKVVEKAYKMMEKEYKDYIPELEVGEVVEINDVWDGNGEVPEKSYSYQITDLIWINYEFEIVELKENPLETMVKIIEIELL